MSSNKFCSIRKIENYKINLFIRRKICKRRRKMIRHSRINNPCCSFYSFEIVDYREKLTFYITINRGNLINLRIFTLIIRVLN